MSKQIRIRKSAVNSIIGQALQDCRLRNELSISAVESLAKIKDLQKIESGDYPITVFDLYRLSVVFKTSARAFMPTGQEVNSWQRPTKKEPPNPAEDVVEVEGEQPDE